MPFSHSLRGSAPARVAVPPITARAGGGPLAAALLAVAISPATPLSAADDQPAGEPLPLEPVVVVSSRSPRPISEVVGMISVIDDSDIATRMATNEDGLWRYTPGIQVESSGTRFSARSLSIRGIGGNRVVMEVDGIPIQDRLSVGNFAFAGRTGSELDFIRRIEVLRGPASSLYGSKAIGGVVAVSTFDPEDLAVPQERPYARLGGSYSGDWDSTGASAIGAWRGDSVGLLLGASHRQGHEPDRSADPPNPDRLDRDRSAMLAKLTLADGVDGRLRLTLDGDRDESTSALNSFVGQGRFANTTELTGDDRVTRTGLALDGRLSRGSVHAEGALFHRETRTRQDTMDLRENLAEPVRVEREFRYETKISGARGRVTREFQRGGFRHRVMLGAEVARSRLEESRDALQTRLSDGESTSVVLGEQFPLRDFPVTVSDEAGVFLQDEIDSLAGHLTVIPSLRFDRTRIRVRDDEGWRQANPEAELAEVTVSDVSPRLGVLWRPSRGFQAWGQLASGFRAPPAEDLNIGLDIPRFNIRALPNPELKSESSLGWEIGFRANAAGAWLSTAAFWTDYEDFIASLVPLGPDPETGTLLFQSQNLDRVRIKGVEIEAGTPLGTLTPALDAFTVRLAGYWAEGENRRTGQDLDDVGPLSAALHLDWASVSGRWDVRLSGTFTGGKSRADVGAQMFFSVPGHGIVDLTTAWHATDRLTIRAGLFNLGDKTWWRWGDVRRLPAGDPLIPSLSAPGRSASVSFNLGLGPGRQ
ncbi:MAG TPA: TonB-dependent receptor [Gammaproteobacteria bacterium]|nr:TonB-dependent receptor [Gammaproteobacteria bacterium]